MLVTDIAKSHDVLEALSDEYPRRILVSITSRSLSVDEICREEHIPISTCYRRIRNLEATGIAIKRIAVSPIPSPTNVELRERNDWRIS